MQETMRKVLNSRNKEIRNKMDKVDSSFGSLIDKLDDLKLPREIILIQGMFVLLEYNIYGMHQGDNSILNLLRTNLEAFKMFLEMRTDTKKYSVPPCSITSDDEMHQVIIDDRLSRRGLGAVESHNLVVAILEHLSMHAALRDAGGSYYNTLNPTTQ